MSSFVKKFLYFILVSCFGVYGDAYGRTVIPKDLDFQLTSEIPRDDHIFYGWKLFTWADWLKRPSSQSLVVPLIKDGNLVPLDKYGSPEVFEARSAAIINRPISHFTAARLHNIETLKHLDAENSYQQIKQSPFTFETTIPFPEKWGKFIWMGKLAKQLADDNEDKLVLISQMALYNLNQIQTNPNLQKKAQLLNLRDGQIPSSMNVQATMKFNQLGVFGSTIQLFYPVDESRTLMVTYFVLAIKRKYITEGGVLADLQGRKTFLGQNLILNTPSGIGAGLPKYVEGLLARTCEGLSL